MTYLGELRYDGNEKAQKLYSELVKWNIESFVNSSEKDLDKGSNSIKTKDGSDIYIHTSFGFDGDDSMKISGYVVYADGNKSDVITFSPLLNLSQPRSLSDLPKPVLPLLRWSGSCKTAAPEPAEGRVLCFSFSVSFSSVLPVFLFGKIRFPLFFPFVIYNHSNSPTAYPGFRWC